jgi:hypothetical protein
MGCPVPSAKIFRFPSWVDTPHSLRCLVPNESAPSSSDAVGVAVTRHARGDDALCHAGCLKSESIHRAPMPAMPWPHPSAPIGLITGAGAVARMLFQNHAQPPGMPSFSGRSQCCGSLYASCKSPVFNRSKSSQLPVCNSPKRSQALPLKRMNCICSTGT